MADQDKWQRLPPLKNFQAASTSSSVALVTRLQTLRASRRSKSNRGTWMPNVSNAKVVLQARKPSPKGATSSAGMPTIRPGNVEVPFGKIFATKSTMGPLPPPTGRNSVRRTMPC